MFFIILKKKLILLEEFILNSISIDRMEKKPCHSTNQQCMIMIQAALQVRRILDISNLVLKP